MLKKRVTLPSLPWMRNDTWAKPFCCSILLHEKLLFGIDTAVIIHTLSAHMHICGLLQFTCMAQRVMALTLLRGSFLHILVVLQLRSIFQSDGFFFMTKQGIYFSFWIKNGFFHRFTTFWLLHWKTFFRSMPLHKINFVPFCSSGAFLNGTNMKTRSPVTTQFGLNERRETWTLKRLNGKT